jgi:hypothetical protein
VVSNILVGTASWTDKSLVQSGWYPPGVSSAEDRLRYYADHFPVVEVDSTYYFLPTYENAQRWAQRTPSSFTFNIKAFSLLTQHPTKPAALPKDIPAVADKKNIYLKDIPGEIVERIWFRYSMRVSWAGSCSSFLPGFRSPRKTSITSWNALIAWRQSRHASSFATIVG